MDDPLGPAFDTAPLLRPMQRKLVCCWMESAGFKTLLLPRVWQQLVDRAGSSSRFRSTDAWVRLAKEPNLPYRWVDWTSDLEDAAYDLRSHFTEACFPNRTAEQISYDSDAVIVSQALALGTDMLVTSDVNTIDHYEINLVVEQRLGRNTGFVVTLDDALQQAHPGCDAGQSLLTLALATIAPPPERKWPVEAAHRDLEKLQQAAIGASLRKTAMRLDTRWNQCPDLEETLAHAQTMAAQSRALETERLLAAWQTSCGHPPSKGNGATALPSNRPFFSRAPTMASTASRMAWTPCPSG